MSINLDLSHVEVTETLSVDFGQSETILTYINNRARYLDPGAPTVIRLRPRHVRWLIDQLQHALTTGQSE